MSTQQWLDKIRTGSDSDQPRSRPQRVEFWTDAVLTPCVIWLVAIAPSSDFASGTLNFAAVSQLCNYRFDDFKTLAFVKLQTVKTVGAIL